MALKSLCDMDLKRFAQASPTLHPINGNSRADSRTTITQTIVGISLSETSAINLVRDICYTDRLMHSTGLVHRDIKPKTSCCAMAGQRLLILDSHFFVEEDRNGKYCIVQEGRVEGKVRYVPALDVALSRGCQEGDRYATV